MFTGIIECIGQITGSTKSGTNRVLTITSPISGMLKPDQSVSHNGVCLTVTHIENNEHRVTVVEETLNRTTLGSLLPGDYINLERAMPASGRFDGHIVQGHVDQTARCVRIEDRDGSLLITFEFTPSADNPVVEKGSICVDGVSLTVASVDKDQFSIAVIPYTLVHTTFQFLKEGQKVNLEFDIIGKYIARLVKNYSSR